MKNLRAYTLAEIVVTMIIIAVVAGISIKISKTKLDKILTYTYYAAYSTLKEVSSEIYSEFSRDAQDEDNHYIFITGDRTGWPDAQEPTTGGSYKQVLATLPRNSQQFCRKFEEYVNTAPIRMPGSDEILDNCHGDKIEDDDTNFRDMNPDLVLRNGMRLYNLCNGETTLTDNNYIKIDALDKFTTTETDIVGTGGDSINQYGYIVYIDINGNEGSSRLWDDVYPFYITLGAKVIPGVGPGEAAAGDEYAGGGNKKYLQASVKRESATTGNIEWGPKSVTFKEAACSSGYIKEDPKKYCKNEDAPDYDVIDECNDPVTICRLQIIKPLKTF